MKIYLLLVFCVLSSNLLLAQDYQLQKAAANTTANFRGLSVVNNKVAWLSGTQGTIGRTTDGGITWTFSQVKDFETVDFRSLYAFDSERAVIANAGSPAHILITYDGGRNWKSVYTNAHPDAFFDGIDFWNDKNGIIYGDPIDGRMLMLRTEDGGQTWSEVKGAPMLEKGEASFAASGTGIRCLEKNQVMICTGGTVSRLWLSNNNGTSWSGIAAPILQGESTTGIFSFVKTENMLTIVGGDYKNESITTNHNFYSLDNGNHWLVPTSPTRGYRECVESIQAKTLLAVGPTGIDISNDNGLAWKPFSEEKGLHVARKARRGSLVIIAGANGQVFIAKKSTQ